MSVRSQNERILFGLKVKQLRQQKGLSFAELAERTGMSISYLNEIEKGKKYPKAEKAGQLAQALGVPSAELASAEVDEGLAPVSDLLKSNFLNELPLELFGIDLAKVVEIIANAPTRVNAFISTLLELSRNYALRQENFYFSALRSFLELHNNYFEELEAAARTCMDQYALPAARPLHPELLGQILTKHFGYTLQPQGLDAYPELAHLRAVFIPRSQSLLLASNLNATQRAFEYGKELGFQYLELHERAYTSSILRGEVFEQVLNHSKAIYFSVALHLPEQLMIDAIGDFFRQERWAPEHLLHLLQRFAATPEMLYHRLTNLLPRWFGIKKLFFLRFVHDLQTDTYEVDRELHLNHRHQPHGNGLLEHYCRRWLAIAALQELPPPDPQAPGAGPLLATAQLSRYFNTPDEYLCLTLARSAYPAPHKNVSVTLGLLVNEELRKQIRFASDPAIPTRTVHTTCERCPIADCAERAAPPTVVEARRRFHQVQDRLNDLLR